MKEEASTKIIPRSIISASILAADFACLVDEAKKVLEGGAHWLHLDIMDGHFVPNISFGPPIVTSLRKAFPDIFFDVHLMVASPEFWIEPFVLAGANLFTFHLEAVENCEMAIELGKKIVKRGMQAGLAIKPNTPITDAFPALDSGVFTLMLVMTVEPGFGGQKFMWDMLEKVKLCRKRYESKIDIEVDGGLGVETTDASAKSGANVIVAGTSIFKAEDMKATIKTMTDLVERNCLVHKVS